MLYLLLTVALNVLLIVEFKVFSRLKVDNLQAIVVNYWVCVITGSLFVGEFPVSTESITQPWLPWALIMGLGFISLFNLIAYCTKKDGITTTTIANKLSLVIPVTFAVWLYDDQMSVMKITGILLAIPAVYLSSRAKEENKARQNLWIAFLLFCASGLLDTLVNYVTNQFFRGSNPGEESQEQSRFLVHTFVVAALLGTATVTWLLATHRKTFAWKNVAAGLTLGVPNFFSMYYFMRLLQSGFLPGSAAIPVNNIGIVLLATLTAILFFREKAGPPRWIGMVLAIVAILLIMISDLNA